MFSERHEAHCVRVLLSSTKRKVGIKRIKSRNNSILLGSYANFVEVIWLVPLVLLLVAAAADVAFAVLHHLKHE